MPVGTHEGNPGPGADEAHGGDAATRGTWAPDVTTNFDHVTLRRQRANASQTGHIDGMDLLAQ